MFDSRRRLHLSGELAGVCEAGALANLHPSVDREFVYRFHVFNLCEAASHCNNYFQKSFADGFRGVQSLNWKNSSLANIGFSASCITKQRKLQIVLAFVRGFVNTAHAMNAQTQNTPALTTKITKYDGEYRVRLFIGGVHQAGADYFTDDKADATATAAAMRENGVESDKTTDFAKDEAADNLALYHVCNDYSLEQDDDIDVYGCVSSEHGNGMAYFNDLGEMIYFRGPKGMNGQEI